MEFFKFGDVAARVRHFLRRHCSLWLSTSTDATCPM